MTSVTRIGSIGGFAIVAALAILAAMVGKRELDAFRREKMRILETRTLPKVLDRRDVAAGPRIYLVGDSQVARWPLDLAPIGCVARSGYPGQAAPNIVSAAMPLLPVVGPDILVAIMGGNDVAAIAFLPEAEQDVALATSVAAFRRLIEAAEHAGVGQVLVARVLPTTEGSWMRRLVWGQAATRLNARLDQALQGVCTGPCRLLDIRQVLPARSGRAWPSFLADDIHLNAAAYAQLASVIFDLSAGLTGAKPSEGDLLRAPPSADEHHHGPGVLDERAARGE